MSCEVIVTVRDKQKSFTQKTQVFENITAKMDDPTIEELTAKAIKTFGGLPKDLIVKIKLQEKTES